MSLKLEFVFKARFEIQRFPALPEQNVPAPNQNVAVDESLVATRGRTAMLQYIPTKPAKFGVKFWVLGESASGLHCFVCWFK